MDVGAFFSNQTSLIVVLSTLPFALIALIMLLVVLRNGAKVRSSRNWDSTTGRVLHSGVVSRRRTRSGGGSSMAYYPQVAYEYEVRGQRYQSQRLSFGAVGTGSPQTAEAIAARYAPGGSVEVFYNPANPGEAVLERKSASNKALVFAITLILAILIVTAVVLSVVMGSVGGMVSGLFNFGANPPAATSASEATPTHAPAVTKRAAPTPTPGK